MENKGLGLLVVFITITGYINRPTRINVEHIKMYYEIEEQNFKSRIEFIDKTVQDAVETAEEIDLLLQDEISKRGK